MIPIIIIIIILIYHDFLTSPRRGSQVKSDKTHKQSPNMHPLALMLDACTLSSVVVLFTVYPNHIM